MLFTGTHPRSLDDKKRLVLPKRIREQLGQDIDRLYLTQGMDQCLWLFARPALEQLAAKLDDVPATAANARVFRRLFFAQMEVVDIDKSGRILIPERLAAFAGLEHEAVLIGVENRMELWDSSRWQSYLDTHGKQFDKVAEGAFSS